MNWNKILIVYSKWVLILSRFILLFVVVYHFAFGPGFDYPNSLEIKLDVSEGTFEPLKEVLSIKPEFSDKVESVESLGGSRLINAKMHEGVFTGVGIHTLILVAGVFAFLQLLLQIVKSAERKEFFSSKNVRRIRLIGFGLAGWAIVDYVFTWYRTYIADKYLDSVYLENTRISIPFVPDLFGNTFVIGLIVLIMAQAFDHGLKLEKEQELTI
ncbi:MAG: DUF2975 domain-containing protein [Roseivirga sp.]|nr:DUF2975 domain-containing protein [Roseivirga sp.]